METLGNPSGPQAGRKLATGKAKRYVAAAALLAGGLTVGAFVSPLGPAGAQSDSTVEEDTDTSTDSTAEEGERQGRHRGQRGARLENLSELIGISQDELRERFGEGMSVAEIAEAEGVSTESLVAGLVDAIEERLADAVADERIDQTTADERLAGAEDRVQEFINGTPGERRGEGFGRQGRHGRPGQLGPIGAGFSELEELLGLSADDIRGGLTDGQSLAEIAAGAGVSEDDLVSALVGAATERIDAAVADDKIDAERADELKASLEDRVGDLVNREPGEGRRHGHFGRRGPNRGAVGDEGEVQESSLSA